MRPQNSKEVAWNSSRLALALSLVTVCLPFVGLTLYLFTQSSESEQRAVEVDTAIVGKSYGFRVESFLRERLGVLRQAVAFFEQIGEPTPEQFATYVDTVLRDFPEFSAINYIGPDLTIVKVHPIETNREALGLNISKIPDWRHRARAVLEGDKSAAASLVNFAQGGRGLVFVVPVRDESGTVIGLVEGVSKLPGFFQRLFMATSDRFWHCEIMDSEGERIYSNKSKAEHARLPTHIEESTMPIHFADRVWHIAVHPTDELIASLQTTSPQNILVMGCAATTIMLCGAFLLYQRHRGLAAALQCSNNIAGELEETSSRLRNLIDGVEAIVYEMDRHSFEFTFVSEGVEKILGYPRDLIVQDRNFWIQRIVEQDRRKVAEATRRAIHENASVAVEYRMESADEATLWFKDRVSVIEQGGEIVGIRGVMFDVTSVRRTQASLRASERRFIEVMENLELAVLILDPFGTITYCNDGFTEMTGYSRRDALFKDIIGLLLPEQQRALALGHLRDAVSAQQVWPRGRTAIVTASGEQRVVAWNGVVSLADDGKVTAISLLGEDITEQEREEEARRQAQKLESLGVLAGGIAHDFNNLLTAIMGNTSLAMNAVDPNSSVYDYLDKVSATSQRLSDLTRQLLAYSGRGNFIVRPIELNRVVQEMNELISVSVPKRTEIRFKLARELPTFDADMVQIEQVILNLITNAAEAIPNGLKGVVEIRTSTTEFNQSQLHQLFSGQGLRPGRYLMLEVEDNGCGMDAKTVSRIFDPFFTTKFTGRGLGLAALRGIVKGHEGGIHIKTEIGQGTCFKIIFPIKLRPAPPPEPETFAGSDWIGQGTALVVDDEETLRFLTAESLENAGFQILQAPDGEAAIECFRQHADEISLILLDVTMPRLSCEQTLEGLLEIDANITIVLTSGYARSEILRRFRNYPIANFLPKPFLPNDLREAIRQALQPAARLASSELPTCEEK